MIARAAEHAAMKTLDDVKWCSKIFKFQYPLTGLKIYFKLVELEIT